MECLSKLQANVITEKGTRLSLFKPNHVLSVCQPVSRLLVKRILLVSVAAHGSHAGDLAPDDLPELRVVGAV